MSCRTLTGIDDLLAGIREFHRQAVTEGSLVRKRNHQGVHWMNSHLLAQLQAHMSSDEHMAKTARRLTKSIEAGDVSPREAAKTLFQTFIESVRSS